MTWQSVAWFVASSFCVVGVVLFPISVGLATPYAMIVFPTGSNCTSPSIVTLSIDIPLLNSSLLLLLIRW